jgi:acetyl-CoA/propionyl-CoA carboxylase biotin carboxyl carrier protein
VFERILIANRGEIAVRIARTCREIGIDSVAVYSDADASSRHRAVAAEAMRLPGITPADTYLNADAIIAAAHASGAQAIHPGYGFLSESADFAEAVIASGLVWVGPPPEVARAVGDKITARGIAAGAGVPVVPGLMTSVQSADEVALFGDEHGYPVAVKAAGGGGGRGLKIARAAGEVADALASARREAQAYFGSRDVYVERYLESPKHVEVQILAPAPGDAMSLGVRDCSLQRRHQKLVEETPPPGGAPVDEMGEAAVALAKACGYVNAGTIEMLLDRDESFYFLEVNARLQVEHTVTEEVLGIDLVACQLRIAAGEHLGFTQGDLEARGHAIECRINAEDPAAGFAPSPGVIRDYAEPAGTGVRVDSGYAAGDVVPEAYDSLLAKLVTWGSTREQARRRMLRALAEMRVVGVATTIPAHRLLIDSAEFRAGTHTTTSVERSGVLEALGHVLLVDGRPARLWNPAMAASAGAMSGGGGHLVAPMQGIILSLLVADGEEVEAGQAVALLEAMKMETTLVAPRSGRARLTVAPGDATAAGDVVARIE